MKKSLFVLTAALLATTAASAADINNPFYLPTKGGVLSDTNVIFQNTENGDSENILLSEGIAYGITDKFAVTGTLADAWYLDQKGTTGHDRYDNPAFNLGVKYNLIDCPKSNVKVQVGAAYTQGSPSLDTLLNDANWFDHHGKALSGFVKAGYEVSEGFLPYVTGTVVKTIGDWESDPYYIGRLGVYKTLTTNLSADAGVNYAWDSATDEIDSGKHDRTLSVDGALNYKLSDSTSVGLTASYAIDNRREDYDYYTVGVNFKVAF